MGLVGRIPVLNNYSLHFNYIEMNRPIIYYRSEVGQSISLKVFDISGKEVFVLNNLDLSGKARPENQLRSGIYICQMFVDGTAVLAKKIRIFE